MLAARRAPRIVAGVALPFWVLCVVLAALMLFVWFFTAHRFGWTNHNLLLFNPLCLLLLPGGWRIVRGRAPGPWFGRWLGVVAARSEEHTSELQSLMRSSYAVFCLKKKTINNTLCKYK